LLDILNFDSESFLNEAVFDSKKNFGVVVVVPYICIYTGESKMSTCSSPV
jgi:hypothetical protein